MAIKNRLEINDYTRGILNADISILSKAITLVESSRDSDQLLARELLEKIIPFTGNSFRLGVTGVPGVGKSTFIENFGQLLINEGKKLAVLTIDPSSSISGGSILGDKTRMEKLSVSAHAYIRPSPSGGNLGGVARKTRETIMLCEAAGFDFIIVETVGVGQSETAVHQLSDFFLLLMLAGAGDELQGIKRGIMELADGIAITKADGNNAEKAKLARAEYANALHYFPPAQSDWIPQVTTCSALHNLGLNDVFEMINSYENKMRISGFLHEKRKQQALYWFEHLLTDQLRDLFFSDENRALEINSAREKVKNGQISPYSAVLQLLEKQTF